MKRFLLKFGDNDFGRTLRAFGNLFMNPEFGDAFDWLTRERIVELWNELSYGLYLMHQKMPAEARTLARVGVLDPRSNSTRSYLNVPPEDVFLDDDAVEYMNANASMWNHSWLFVDLEYRLVTLV